MSGINKAVFVEVCVLCTVVGVVYKMVGGVSSILVVRVCMVLCSLEISVSVAVLVSL